VLQRVAACCSVLQCVAVNSCDDHLDVGVHKYYMLFVLQRVAACCSVLQCVAVNSCDDDLDVGVHNVTWCLLQCVAVCCSGCIEFL